MRVPSIPLKHVADCVDHICHKYARGNFLLKDHNYNPLIKQCWYFRSSKRHIKVEMHCQIQISLFLGVYNPARIAIFLMIYHHLHDYNFKTQVAVDGMF